MTLPRREWLKLSAGAAAAMAWPGAFGGAARRVETIGLQLFTVREQMAVDVPATLAAVAAAGYREVETAGTGSLSTVQFAAALADAGLAAPAAHVSFELMAEQGDRLLEAAEVIGYRYLVLPWIAPPLRTAQGYGTVAQTLNRFGEQCLGAGVQVAYHNHDFEFLKVGGEVAFDFLLRECDPRLVRFELDLFWAKHAGANAAAYLSADPSRFPLCHVKDRNAAGEMVDVGAGEIDFSRLFAAGSGLEHYFVEHDRPVDALTSIRNSIAAVRAIRF